MRHLEFAALVAAFFVADQLWGPIGRTRFMGCYFIAYGLYAWATGSPRGSHQAWFLAPLFALGLAFVTYAPAITCASSRYEHLCK